MSCWAYREVMAGDGVQTFLVSAAAYDGHVGRYGSELGRGLIRFAGVASGDRVVEIGAGTGLLTAELAAAVGRGGSVTAVEPSAPLAEACRERVPSVEVRSALGEDLPFANAQFDAAVAQLVVNFLTDPRAGVHEMRRVVRGGGIVAASVWDYAGEMTLLRTFWDAAIAVDSAATGKDEGAVMQYCEPMSLRALWVEAGLSDVEVSQLSPAVRYVDFDELWLPFTKGVGPSGAYTVSLDQTGQTALRTEFFRRLGAPTGPFTLTARAWVVRGRV
jgi:SAM-dependent methyltransferase